MKISLCYPNFLKKALTFSFDDGTYQDLEMLNILNSNSLKATFNLNSAYFNAPSYFIINNWLVNHRLTKDYIAKVYQGHELAAHTYTHTDFKDQSDENLEREITNDIKNISKISKKKVLGLAYPYGIYSDKIIAKLKENGIIYARSINSNFNFNLPKDFYTYGGTCTLSDAIFPTLIKKWNKLAPKQMKLFYIWGHSYELDMFHEHEKIFNLFSSLANKEDTYYATNGEIFTYLLAFKKLKINQKKKLIINNSDLDIYLIVDNLKIILKKGETYHG